MYIYITDAIKTTGPVCFIPNALLRGMRRIPDMDKLPRLFVISSFGKLSVEKTNIGGELIKYEYDMSAVGCDDGVLGRYFISA